MQFVEIPISSNQKAFSFKQSNNNFTLILSVRNQALND